MVQGLDGSGFILGLDLLVLLKDEARMEGNESDFRS